MAAIVGMTSAPAVYRNVIVAEADETDSTNSVKYDAWWTNHTFGEQVTDTEKTVSFKAKSYSNAANNWNTPSFAVYYGNENKVGGDGYQEVCVIRSDLWAWFDGDATNKTRATLTESWNTKNIKFDMSEDPGTFDWSSWLSKNKEGVDVSVTSYIKDGVAYITVDNAGLKSTTSFDVDTTKKLFISVCGELCEVSGLPDSMIKGTPAPTEEPTVEPTTAPAVTAEPTVEPTTEPTAVPTEEPTVAPTAEPTVEPTAEPTEKPELKTASITVKNGNKKVSAVTVKKGKSVKLTVSANSKAKVTAAKLSTKDAKVAKVTLSGNKLTVKGLKKGKVSVKLTAKKTASYKAASKTVKVTVK